jgi:hypothetical protein
LGGSLSVNPGVPGSGDADQFRGTSPLVPFAAFTPLLPFGDNEWPFEVACEAGIGAAIGQAEQRVLLKRLKLLISRVDLYI